MASDDHPTPSAPDVLDLAAADRRATTDGVVLPSPRLDVDALVRRTEALLAAGVPLSLLLDLASPTGPDSKALYATER
jgi:hypothetical protein